MSPGVVITVGRRGIARDFWTHLPKGPASFLRWSLERNLRKQKILSLTFFMHNFKTWFLVPPIHDKITQHLKTYLFLRNYIEYISRTAYLALEARVTMYEVIDNRFQVRQWQNQSVLYFTKLGAPAGEYFLIYFISRKLQKYFACLILNKYGLNIWHMVYMLFLSWMWRTILTYKPSFNIHTSISTSRSEDSMNHHHFIFMKI